MSASDVLALVETRRMLTMSLSTHSCILKCFMSIWRVLFVGCFASAIESASWLSINSNVAESCGTSISSRMERT